METLPSDRAFLTEGCQAWSLASTPTAAPAAPEVAAPANPQLPTANAGFSCTYRAALTLRTKLSAVLICDDGTGGYTYKGLRLKDGARIDVPGAIPTSTGFTATNNGTRYDVSQTGLVIQTPDGEVYSEPAIASG